MESIQVNEELLSEDQFLAGEEQQAQLREMLKFDQRRVILGIGALAQLGEECRRLDAGKILLVHDPGVPQLAARVRAAVQDGALQLVGEFDQIVPNPTVASVDALAAAVKESGCDAVVALGGGSTLDSAKVGLSVATCGGSTAQYFGMDLFPEPTRWPLIAMPTTSGTGAEASRVAIVVAEEGKQAVFSDYIQPPVAIVDSEMAADMPPALTAMTGLDAIGHALECTASTKTNDVADAVARESVRSGMPYLERAILKGSADPEARFHMARCSLLGGMLLSPVNTGPAHALGYGIEKLSHARGKAVPHGAAVGLVLPGVMRLNTPAVAEKYFYTAAVGGLDLAGKTREQGAAAAAQWIDERRRQYTPFGSLADADLGEEDIPKMLEMGMAVTRLLDPNPVEVTEEVARAIYREVLT